MAQTIDTIKKNDDLYLSFILGNEHVKRAIEVAYASGQSLLIIGGRDTQAEEISDLLLNDQKPEYEGMVILPHNRQIMSWTPCPCGYCNHPTIPCTCSVKERREHLKEKPITDMEVIISAPMWSYIEDIISKDLDQPSITLLRAAYEHLDNGYGGILNVIARTKAIAKMDKEKEIKTQHIAEAIQYHPSDNK